MRVLVRTSALLTAALLLSVLPAAVRAQAGGTGTVVGTVSNEATRKVLERATVTLVGTGQSTLTAADGSFRLPGVPAGAQKIQVGYAGLEDATVAVAVASGGVTTASVALKSDVVRLSEFRVASEPEGNAYAIQQQKNAESQRTVVSADAFGVVSDANPGEFLKLMPGIQMDYTGVEPRGLMVRGMEPNLNLIMINGNQAASASSSATNRTFEFDQTTIDNIESMEVYKATVPWLPANSIGGTVNLVTRSAFLQKGRRVNATFNLTGNSDNLSLGKTSGPNDKPERKIHPGGSFTYSDSFLDHRVGVVLSLSQVNVNGYGGTAYNTYTYLAPLPAAPAPYTLTNPAAYVSQYQREDHQNFTRRSGGSLNLDFKASDTTTAFLRTTLTDHYYEFRNRFLRLNAGAIVGSATPQRLETTNGNSEQNMSFGNKQSDAWSINPGVKHRFDAWTIEYDGSVSRATNRYDYLPWMFGGVTLRNSGVGYILEKNPASAVATRITQTAGADVYNLGNGNYQPVANSITVGNRSSVDRILAAKGRVRRDFSGPNPFYLEAGAAFQEQERSRQNPSRQWSYAGPDGIVGTADDTTQAVMQQFAEQSYTPKLWFGERSPNAWISPFQLAKLYSQAPQAFVENVGNSYDVAFRNNQRITETITAGYAMANVKFGRLDVLAGARVERTEVEGEGARQNNALAAGLVVNSLAYHIARLSRTKAATDYTPDPFKYLHLTWHANRQWQARASYTEAIGRPNFGSILPGISINDASRTVSVANTELLPQRAKNLDASIEWYPSGTSSFTAAWFRKDIDDYIVNNSFTLVSAIPELDLGSDLIGYTASTSSNLGRAKIEGFELSGRYKLAFLPRWLNKLEVFGNYTKLYTTEGTFVAGAASTVYNQLPNLAPELWNLGFAYSTPDGKWFLSLRANFVNDIPRNVTGRPQEQSDERLTYEGEVRYAFSPRYTLSLAGRNITEAREGGSQIGRAIRTGTGGGSALTLTLAARF
ncbi:TonB-dependent receptor [Horticoccus sp. 23ND18S-11]|uniref:TonB-dependent receptor n=1 Tax=Horticoccus sp. 23ND18S-11 TaxID=3391832 RepID=UPI0039C9841D